MALSPKYSLNFIYFYLSSYWTLLKRFRKRRYYELLNVAEWDKDLLSWGDCWSEDSFSCLVMVLVGFTVALRSFGNFDGSLRMFVWNDFLPYFVTDWFKNVSVWFMRYFISLWTYYSSFFNGTSLDDFNLLNVLLISFSFPVPMIWI